jgi:hypothetical protein
MVGIRTEVVGLCQPICSKRSIPQFKSPPPCPATDGTTPQTVGLSVQSSRIGLSGSCRAPSKTLGDRIKVLRPWSRKRLKTFKETKFIEATGKCVFLMQIFFESHCCCWRRLSGCCNSFDGFQVSWERCPDAWNSDFYGKEGYPTIMYQIVVNHATWINSVTPGRRLISPFLCSILKLHSAGFPGATNDKTGVRYDSYVARMRTDPLFTEYEYPLVAQSIELGQLNHIRHKHRNRVSTKQSP